MRDSRSVPHAVSEAEISAAVVSLSARDGGGYRIEIDGPYSLFESVTKYGLELALLLPALEACDSVQLRRIYAGVKSAIRSPFRWS